MSESASAGVQTAGRIARGSAAGVALVLNGLGALVLLAWHCCGAGSPAENARSPFFVATVCAFLVALTSIPPVSSLARLTPWLRWGAVPLLLGTGFFLAGLANMMLDGLREWFVVLTFALTALCAIYVLVRVVIAPRPSV